MDETMIHLRPFPRKQWWQKKETDGPQWKITIDSPRQRSILKGHRHCVIYKFLSHMFHETSPDAILKKLKFSVYHFPKKDE